MHVEFNQNIFAHLHVRDIFFLIFDCQFVVKYKYIYYCYLIHITYSFAATMHIVYLFLEIFKE